MQEKMRSSLSDLCQIVALKNYFFKIFFILFRSERTTHLSYWQKSLPFSIKRVEYLPLVQYIVREKNMAVG